MLALLGHAWITPRHHAETQGHGVEQTETLHQFSPQEQRRIDQARDKGTEGKKK